MKTLLEMSGCLLLSTNQKKVESLWRDDPCYKFIFSLKGSMRYQSKRNDLFLHEHEFIVFNPSEEHRQMAVEDHKFLVELDASFLNEAVSSITVGQRDIFFAQFIQKNPLVTQWVQFIYSYIQMEEQSENKGLSIFLDHTFTQLSVVLARAAVSTQSTDFITQPFSSVQPALAQVMAALKNDYQHPWSLEEMASILHISKFQFAHLFKEAIGVSPFSWLQIYRLVRSQELLLYTNQKIMNIALGCGFSSVAVYNQLFKRLYGFAPSFFRKSYSNQIKH